MNGPAHPQIVPPDLPVHSAIVTGCLSAHPTRPSGLLPRVGMPNIVLRPYIAFVGQLACLDLGCAETGPIWPVSNSVPARPPVYGPFDAVGGRDGWALLRAKILG